VRLFAPGYIRVRSPGLPSTVVSIQERRNQPKDALARGIVGVRAVRESLQLPPSRWRTSDRCTEASQPAGSLKVTRVIYLENAPFVTGEIRPVDDGQSAAR
jgi:hypothetical protein